MKSFFRFLSLVIVPLSTSTAAFAGPVRLGAVLGGNFTSFNFKSSADARPSGYGFGGGATASFFQSSLLGFRIALLENYVSTAIGTGATKASGSMPTATATLNVNYDVPDGRMSVGVGAGIASLSGMKCSGSACPSFPSTATGLAGEAKFAAKANGLTGLVQGFLPVDGSRRRLGLARIFFGIGWDFGRDQK